MKIEDIRRKSDPELGMDLEKLQKELFHLKFRAAYDTESDTAKISESRRSIARIKTVLHERARGIRGQSSQS